MSLSKKWDTLAQLDLCMAVILTGGSVGSYKWPEIHDLMTKFGHGFTKDAISQHFTKVILRNFKNRHGLPPGRLEPMAPAQTKRKAGDNADESPSKRKAK